MGLGGLIGTPHLSQKMLYIKYIFITAAEIK